MGSHFFVWTVDGVVTVVLLAIFALLLLFVGGWELFERLKRKWRKFFGVKR